MTKHEALVEARRRWGAEAYVQTPAESGFEPGVFILWRPRGWCVFHTAGIGSSWEAAFADADRRATGRDG